MDEARIDSTGDRIAVNSGLPAPREWFVFQQGQGGWYTDGELEEVATWQPLIPDPGWTPVE